MFAIGLILRTALLPGRLVSPQRPDPGSWTNPPAPPGLFPLGTDAVPCSQGHERHLPEVSEEGLALCCLEMLDAGIYFTQPSSGAPPSRAPVPPLAVGPGRLGRW